MIRYYFYFMFIMFYYIYLFLYYYIFCDFGWVPGGSGRFGVGSGFYRHPKQKYPTASVLSEPKESGLGQCHCFLLCFCRALSFFVS